MPHATYQETPIRIDSPQGTAWGVVCAPAHGMQSAHLGVVFVSGGFQYRAGSHRQTVQLARHLATAGVASLRFDLAGLGDATGTVHSFEQLYPQLTAAIGALTQHATALQGIVLWGLCDGASAALLYCEHARDPRIAGLALVNPWVRSEASLARTHVQHYYLRRLQDKAFWQKLLRGGVGASEALQARMEEQIAKRDASQPTKERSAGSTFRNPVGYSSTGRADDSHELKAWKVIDEAGLRGATLGGAQMSPMHSNFLINTGAATSADIEALGEEVRKRVKAASGVELEWEIQRVGRT